MKQVYLKFSMLLLCLVAGLSSAWADDVTFTFKTDEDITYTKTGTSGGGAECIVSKSNVTLSGTNAYTEATKTLSVYAKSTLTITAPGNITNIALEYNGKVYPFDEAVGDGKKGEKFAASGAHAATYTPATPATSITLNNPNGGKTELLSLKVTYIAGTVVNVTGVSLSETSKTIMATEKFTLTATVAPADATNKLVQWSSDDETVAKVDNGVVTGFKAGTATITVTTLDGSKTASCEVTVTAKEKPAGAVFYESFDGCDGNGGNDGVWSNISATKVFHNTDNEGWTWAGSIMSGSQCASIRKVDASTPSSLTTPAIGVAGNGKVVFNAEAWGNDTGDFYVTLVGGGTFVEGTPNLSNNSTKAKVALQKAGAWKTYTLEFEGLKADSKIKFEAPANKRVFLDEVAVYVEAAPSSYELTIGSAEYATFFDSKNAYVMPEDCEGYVFTVANGLEAAYEGGDVVPAGEPLVIYTIAPGTKTLTYTTSTEETLKSGGMNELEGTDAETAIAADDNSYFYALSLDAEGANVGFYWMNTTGAAFTNGAHKAYLKAAKTATSAKSFTFAGATAIKSVTTATDSKIYDMTGREVCSPKAGLYIVNGVKKYIK